MITPSTLWIHLGGIMLYFLNNGIHYFRKFELHWWTLINKNMSAFTIIVLLGNDICTLTQVKSRKRYGKTVIRPLRSCFQICRSEWHSVHLYEGLWLQPGVSGDLAQKALFSTCFPKFCPCNWDAASRCCSQICGRFIKTKFWLDHGMMSLTVF